MQIHPQVWNHFQQHRAVSFMVKVSVVAVLGLLFLGVTVGVNVKGAYAHSLSSNNSSSAAVSSSRTSQNAAMQYNMPPTGSGNYFPYPSCTWWANQRYHQLHGVYVPWTSQSNAWQWTDRAYQFGWQVSSRASWGAIIDLQPWVQGAGGYGHVAVVERVYWDGSVLASNMSWWPYPNQVTYVHFYPGYGVTFIQW